MAKQSAATNETQDGGEVTLTALLSQRPAMKRFSFWIVGMTPLICHAWSEKARRQMLEKHVKATKAGKEIRDPHDEFMRSLYHLEDGSYGFPAMAVKKCIWQAAHKDKGITKTAIQGGFWIDAEWQQVRPALAGAACNMPICRIYGSDPEMREDMVKIGSGLTKTAALAYRGSFNIWAMKINGRINPAVLTAEALGAMIADSGMAVGIGEWRNDKMGMFGAFRLAEPYEEEAWDAFAAGTGPLPEFYKEAAE